MTHHVPDGYTSLTPFLCIDGASAAIDFYTSAFGATVVTRNDLPGGKVAHAELQLESGRLQLSDPDPDHHLVAPSGADDVSHSTVLYVPDVDAVHARAVAAGAKSYEGPPTFVTGDRFCSLLDPSGTAGRCSPGWRTSVPRRHSGASTRGWPSRGPARRHDRRVDAPDTR